MYTKTRSFPLIAMAMLIAMLASTPAPAGANHSFFGLHWPREETRFAVRFGDNVSSAWDPHLRSAAEEWSEASVLRARVVEGSTTGRRCRPSVNRVQVCSAAYGDTGILFEATVWAVDSHIYQGTITLNDTYLNAAPFNTRAWRRHILCQLMGFTLGLDLQDFDFSNANLGSCMDLTDNPAGSPRNTEPNRHDFQMLKQIYAHFDDDDDLSLAASAPSSAADAGTARELGTVAFGSPDGRASLYSSDLGNGVRTLTLVGRIK